MPIKKVEKGDYSNTVVYLLRSNDPLIEEKYIGYSKDFPARKREHNSRCNNVKSDEYNKDAYIFIRENGGYDNWDFEILERANLKDKKEAKARERYYIETLKPSLNKNLTGQTPEERAENNRVCNRIKERKKMEDPEYRKKKYEATKKRIEDPEVKKKDAERGKKKITCICGAIHNRDGKIQHLDSKKHKKFLENNPVVN
jgi:hypothetical protein